MGADFKAAATAEAYGHCDYGVVAVMMIMPARVLIMKVEVMLCLVMQMLMVTEK